MEKDNLIVDLTFEFALKVIELAELLESERKFVVANQLLKSGTSIGANVWEAQSAESRADFVHKLKIASKEAHETDYWLKLCDKSQLYPETKELQDEILSIKKVLGKIITSSKSNQTNLHINTSKH